MSKIYYIDNPEKISENFLPDEIECITPEALLEKDIDSEDELVVLCEIDINAENKKISRTDFYGISFVQELRRKGFMNNVLFVSFCGRKHLTADSSNKIINTLGHGFLRLPVNAKEWKKALAGIYPLTELSLLVCQHSYCNKHGLINTITHNLYSKEYSPDELQNMFAKLKSLYPDKDYTDWDRILEQKLKTHKPKSETPKHTPPQKRQSKESTNIIDTAVTDALELTTFIENCANQLKDEYPEESEVSSKKKPHDKYKILWLDDEITDSHRLYQLFKRDVDLLHATNVEKARDYLIEDAQQRRPEIMLVIADYFLKEKKDGVYVDQRVQGYDFLLEVARSSHPAKILALSSMQRHLQSWIAESYGIKYKELPKQVIKIHTIEGAKHVFNEAVKLSNENWMQINRRPTSKNWERHLLPSYIQFIRDRNYSNLETKISHNALRWISKYKNGETPNFLHFGTNDFAPKTSDIVAYSKNAKEVFTNIKNSIVAIKRIKDQNNSIANLINKISDEINHIAKNIEAEPIDPDKLIKNSKEEIKNLKKEIKAKVDDILGDLKLQFNNSKKKKKRFTKYYNTHISPAIDLIKAQIEQTEFSDKGQLSTSNKLKDENKPQFVALLTARRVLLYLTIVEGKSFSEIGDILKKSEDTIKQTINTWAALKIEDFPIGLTIEEENWLARYFHDDLKSKGISVKRDIEKYYLYLNKISKFFRSYFEKARLKNNIEEDILEFFEDGEREKEKKEILFNSELEPTFTTTSEIKGLINFIVAELDIDNREEFTYFINTWRDLLYYIKNLTYKKEYNDVLQKNVKIKTGQRLGNLFSLENFLLNIKPKKYEKELVDLNTTSKRPTIEDEFILLHNPIDHYFSRSSRISPDYLSKSKGVLKIYAACFSGEDEDKKLVANFKSPLFYRAKSYSNKIRINDKDLESFNVHPFLEISSLNFKGSVRNNAKIYELICKSKLRLVEKWNELSMRIDLTRTDEDGNRQSSIEAAENNAAKIYEDNYSDNLDEWDFFSIPFRNQLKNLIENIDEDFPGLEEIVYTVSMDPSKFKKLACEDLTSFPNVIVFFSKHLDGRYTLSDPKTNLSVDSKYIVLGLE